jgi:hypothetical protein
MRHVVRCLCLLFCFLFPVALYAGQIYGFIVKEDGTPLKNAELNINCGGAPISGTTASDRIEHAIAALTGTEIATQVDEKPASGKCRFGADVCG